MQLKTATQEMSTDCHMRVRSLDMSDTCINTSFAESMNVTMSQGK
jgi:hypothetical protein